MLTGWTQTDYSLLTVYCLTISTCPPASLEASFLPRTLSFSCGWQRVLFFICKRKILTYCNGQASIDTLNTTFKRFESSILYLIKRKTRTGVMNEKMSHQTSLCHTHSVLLVSSLKVCACRQVFAFVEGMFKLIVH